MSSVYPGNLDDFTNRQDNVDAIVAADHNDVIDAIENIEGELGTNPSGSYDTVKDRLDALAEWENEFPVPDTEVTLSSGNVGSYSTLDEHVKDALIHGNTNVSAFSAMLQEALDQALRGTLQTGQPSMSAPIADTVMEIEAGDLAVCYPTANPTGSAYGWRMVTTGDTGVSGANLRLDGAASAPTFSSGTLFSKLTPDAAVDVSNSTLVLNAGDIVFCYTTANPTTSAYGWHIVTTGATGVNSASLRLDGQASAPTFSASSRFSVLESFDTALVTDESMGIQAGDVAVAYPTANPTGSAYGWRMVTTGATGVSSSSLRLDGAASAPTFSNGTRFSILRPTASALVTDSDMPLVEGDIVFCYPTANPTGSGYDWHVVTTGGDGVSDSALRLDGAASAPTFSTGSRLSKAVPTYQGVARGGEVIDLVHVPDWMMVTTKGTGTGGGGSAASIYGNITTRLPLPACRGDAEFTAEDIDFTGIGNADYSTAFRMRIPAYAGHEDAYYPEVGMRITLNETTGNCRGRQGAGITNRPLFTDVEECEDNPSFKAFTLGLSANIDWLAAMPLLGRVADPGSNSQLSVGEYVLLIVTSASDAADNLPFVSTEDATTNAVDLFKVPDSEPYFGTGVDGALVIDGTTPGNSTDGKAHPSGYVSAPSGLSTQATTGTLGADTYEYKVTAYNENGETTATATNCTLSQTGGVTLSWSASAGAEGYRIFGRQDYVGYYYMATTTNTTWTDDGSVSPAGATPPASNTAERAYYVDTVKNYTSVTVQNGGVVSCAPYNGNPVGGKLIVYSTGTIAIDASSSITAKGKGYRGGAAVASGVGYQGESINGSGSLSTSNNDGGGGGASGSGNPAAGGGYGTAGYTTGGSTGGTAYGTPDIAILYMGSGGGGGSGPSGGGIIKLSAPTINVYGAIDCNGNNGTDGGGGSGGSIYLKGVTLNLGASKVTANGGSRGGSSEYGGDGRIRLDYVALTGQTDPVPGCTRFMAEGSADLYLNNHTHSAEDIMWDTLPISRGGTGQATKAAAFDALAPTTTKGDLIVFNGTDNVRQAVGSDNQFLLADSAQESGVKWGALPGHKTSHQSGGSDAVKLDDLAAPDDTTDLNASTGTHGLCPKLSGTSTQYLNGTGQWTTPSGSGGGTPGGSNTQVQFNDSGAFGGASHIVYNKDTNKTCFGTSTPNEKVTVDGALSIDEYASGSTPSSTSGYAKIFAAEADGIDSYTKLMLKFIGHDGSQSFKDSSSSPKYVTANGNAQIDSAQYKFSGSSGLFDGSGDYLSLASNTDWNLGTGDFTIDAWVRLAEIKTQCIVSADWYNSAWNGYWALYMYDDGDLAFGRAGVNEVSTTNTPLSSTNTWYHIAVIRNSGTLKIYVDGVEKKSESYTSDLSDNDGLFVGFHNYSTMAFNGWMDELRISKGLARWTSGFTPPGAPYMANGLHCVLSDGTLYQLSIERV